MSIFLKTYNPVKVEPDKGLVLYSIAFGIC